METTKDLTGCGVQMNQRKGRASKMMMEWVSGGGVGVGTKLSKYHLLQSSRHEFRSLV